VKRIITDQSKELETLSKLITLYMCSIYLWLYSPFVGPWPLFQFFRPRGQCYRLYIYGIHLEKKIQKAYWTKNRLASTKLIQVLKLGLHFCHVWTPAWKQTCTGHFDSRCKSNIEWQQWTEISKLYFFPARDLVLPPAWMRINTSSVYTSETHRIWFIWKTHYHSLRENLQSQFKICSQLRISDRITTSVYFTCISATSTSRLPLRTIYRIKMYVTPCDVVDTDVSNKPAAGKPSMKKW
jgi:hypothetical protein